MIPKWSQMILRNPSVAEIPKYPKPPKKFGRRKIYLTQPWFQLVNKRIFWEGPNLEDGYIDNLHLYYLQFSPFLDWNHSLQASLFHFVLEANFGWSVQFTGRLQGFEKIGSTEELHRLRSNCAALGKNRPRECPAAAIFFQVPPAGVCWRLKR